MTKYKCIKPLVDNNNKTIMKYGDVIIINDKQNQLYNVTSGLDFKYTFDYIKDYLVNITDFNPNQYPPIILTNKTTIVEDFKDDEPEIELKNFGNSHFEQIIKGLYNTYKKKNSDYGNSFNDTLDEWGLQAAGIRMSDKLKRFNSIVKNGSFKVKDESIIDTLEDLATYAIMTVMYLQK